MSVEKTFNGLPGWAKGVVAVAGTGMVIWLGYIVYSNVKKIALRKKEEAGSKSETKENTNELNNLTVQGAGPTMSKAQLAATANQIFTAMDGYGTDNKAVLAAFTKVKNKADVLGVIQAFGIREISSGRLNPEPNFKGTLPAALVSEMPATGYGVLNWGLLLVNPVAGMAALNNGDIGLDTVNKLLSEKKIDYQF